MLQKLNDRIQGLLAWVIIGVLAVTFTLFGLDYFFVNRHTDDTLTKVNGHSILKKDFQLAWRRFQKMNPQTSTVNEKQTKAKILNDLVLNEVSIQAAKKQGFSVDDAQVTSSVMQIPAFLDKGKFSNTRYAQLLNGAYFTPQTFAESVGQEMLMNQQRFAWIGTAFVGKNELNEYIQLADQTRSYRYTVIAMKGFMQPNRVTDADVLAYYKTHTQEFLKPEQVSIDYILLSKAQLRKQISVSDEQVKAYAMGTNVDEKMFTPTMAAKIKEQLITERADKEFGEKLELLTDLSYQESDSLQNVAHTLGLPLLHTSPFSKQGGTDSLTKNPVIIKAAFSHDVLKYENNSAPITLSDDDVCVLRIKDYFTEKEQSLSDAKTRIIDVLTKKNAMLAASMHAKDLVAAMSKTNMDAKKSAPLWQTIHDATRYATKPSLLLNEIAFELDHVSAVKQMTTPAGDQVIVQLLSIKPGAVNDGDLSLQQKMRAQLAQNIGSLEYGSYLHHLMTGSDIVKK